MQKQQENPTLAAKGGIKKGDLIFYIGFVAVIVIVCLLLNAVTGGDFLYGSNIRMIISHAVYPTFVAWALCFLLACGYTDMSLGGVLVLGSFAACMLGNTIGYPGVILGGVLVGLILVFINFSVFAFTGIPSWIAGISLALIYEAGAVFLSRGEVTGPLVASDLADHLRALGQLPGSIILLVASMIVIYFVYNRTTVGLNIRAMGGNKDVAKALGVNITKTIICVGIICGIIIGLACVVQQSTNVRTTVKTGLTSMFMVFQPMAVVLLAQILERKINIIIAVPICAFFIYADFDFFTRMGIHSGTLKEACLGAFLIIFGIIGSWGKKGVVK